LSNAEIDNLSNEAAVTALSEVAQSWLSARPGEAGDALLSLTVGGRGPEPGTVPGWAVDSRQVDADAAQLSRYALTTIAEGNDDEAVQWVKAALLQVSRPVPQIFDPVSLGILGGILIGTILASRVKKIGPVEFYEGVPKELADVVRAAGGPLSS
jgi:hypothetical protein